MLGLLCLYVCSGLCLDLFCLLPLPLSGALPLPLPLATPGSAGLKSRISWEGMVWICIGETWGVFTLGDTRK